MTEEQQVMTLYRGYKTKPDFGLTPDEEDERETLEWYRDIWEEKKQLKDFKNPHEEEEFWGVANTMRFRELMKKRDAPQHFTDVEQLAYDYAGKEGYVMRITVPVDILGEHLSSFGEMIKQGEEAHVSTNFVFTSQELHDHGEEWKIHIEEQRREGDEHNREVGGMRRM